MPNVKKTRDKGVPPEKKDPSRQQALTEGGAALGLGRLSKGKKNCDGGGKGRDWFFSKNPRA